MSKGYESKIIDGNISYWKFLEDASQESFAEAFVDFNKVIRQPEITGLIVVVEMKDPMGAMVQDLWLQTGTIADEAGIKKWGIVAPDDWKKIVLDYLARGGKDGQRSYEYFISSSEDEVIAWMKT